MKKCGIASVLLLGLGIEVVSLGVIACWGTVAVSLLIKAAAEGGV